MATIVMNQLKAKVADGTLLLMSDTLKIMLCTSTYVPNADDTFIDSGTASDAQSGEITGVSGYTGGFGGAGRKTIAGKAVSQDNVNDRGEFTFTNPAWTALGAGATIAWAVLVKEITNDLASLVLVAFDVADTPTNGGDITLTVNAEGAIQFS